MNLTLPFLSHKKQIVLGRIGRLFFFPTFWLSEQERATHMYLLGITGQGKSKLLEHMLLQDILAGRGCGLLDRSVTHFGSCEHEGAGNARGVPLLRSSDPLLKEMGLVRDDPLEFPRAG